VRRVRGRQLRSRDEDEGRSEQPGGGGGGGGGGGVDAVRGVPGGDLPGV
jgi:hypothetical protein